MRQASPAELEVLASPHYVTHARVIVTDADGIDRDLTDLAGHNWFVAADWREDVDQPIVQPRVQVWREIGELSLSPLHEASDLNYRLNDTFAPLIDIGRRIRILTATLPPAVEPTPGDWRLVFDGEIDDWEAEHSPMVLICRDPGGLLQDTQIEDPKDYSSEAGKLLHVIMQELLDDTLGPGAVTLYVPSPPAQMITRYRPDPGSLMEALRTCAQSIGWDVRYRWHEATQGFRLTLTEPDREGPEVSHTFGPTEYIDITRLRAGRADIRNVVQVVYQDRVTGQEERVTVEDSASIARFGRRFMRLAEGDDSPIDTGTEALAFAGYALDDLKDPAADHEVELRYWPLAELGDVYEFLANGVHYTTDQTFAVVGIRHRLAEGQQRTTLVCRGKPSGGYLTWLKRARRPPATSTELYAQCHVELVDTQPDYVEIEVTAEPPHGRVWLDSLEGAALIEDDGDEEEEEEEEEEGDDTYPSGTRWLIARPEPTAGQGLAVFGAVAPGYVSDLTPVVIAQQGRDTVALVMRATVIGQTDTTLTVRTAVADPLGGQGLTQPIRVEPVGTAGTGVDWPGKTPSTPYAEIEVAQITRDLDTTGFVDFTITRSEEGLGSVTWTATTPETVAPGGSPLRFPAADTQVVPELVLVRALPPTCVVELESYEEATAEVAVRGRDWQGATSGLEYRWREYTRNDSPPIWPAWQPLPGGEDSVIVDIDPVHDVVVEAQVRDSGARESPIDRAYVPARITGADAYADAIDEMEDRGLGPGGELGTIINAPKRAVLYEVFNGERQEWPYGAIGDSSIIVAHVGGGISWQGLSKWGTLAQAGGDGGRGTGTEGPPDQADEPFVLKPVFRARRDEATNEFIFDAYLMAMTAETTPHSIPHPPIPVTAVGQRTQSTVEMPANDIPALGDSYSHRIRVSAMPEFGLVGPWQAQFRVGVEVGVGSTWTHVDDLWISLAGTGPAMRETTREFTVTYPGITTSGFRWRLHFMDLIVTPGVEMFQSISMMGLMVEWSTGADPLYASATPTEADRARFLVMSQR